MIPNYTIQQLVSFIMVARCGKVTDAAKELYVSQSSLSKTIRKLEENLGVILFDRSVHGVKLTFVSGFKQFENAIESARNAQRVNEQMFRVGVFLTSEHMADFSGVRALINAYGEKYPSVQVLVEFLTNKEMRNGLSSGELDIVFALDSAMTNLYDTELYRMKRVSWEVVLNSEHPMARSGKLDIQELNNETFVFLSADETQIDPTMNRERCLELGFAPKREIVVQNSVSMLEQVKRGAGMFLAVGGMIPTKETTVFRLPDLPNSPYISAVWRSENRSELLTRMREMMKEYSEV